MIALGALKVAAGAFVVSVLTLAVSCRPYIRMDDRERVRCGRDSGYFLSRHPVLYILSLVYAVDLIVAMLAALVAVGAWAVGA